VLRLIDECVLAQWAPLFLHLMLKAFFGCFHLWWTVLVMFLDA
jgi:hypothetical protein